MGLLQSPALPLGYPAIEKQVTLPHPWHRGNAEAVRESEKNGRERIEEANSLN